MVSEKLIMNEKPWYQSKAILGSLSAAVLVLLQTFGVDTDGLEKPLEQALLNLGILFSVGVSIYGRIKANTRIKQ